MRLCAKHQPGHAPAMAGLASVCVANCNTVRSSGQLLGLASTGTGSWLQVLALGCHSLRHSQSIATMLATDAPKS
jgi:hypothetical protein